MKSGVSCVLSLMILALALSASGEGNLTFEAGCGIISGPFTITNGCIFQPSETGLTNSGRAAYTFTITKAGRYRIEGVVIAQGGGENSFYVNLDAEPTDPEMIWDIPFTEGSTNVIVSWRGTGTAAKNQFAPKVFQLSAGEHQLIVRGRGANTQLRRLSLVASPLAPPTRLRIVGPS